MIFDSFYFKVNGVAAFAVDFGLEGSSQRNFSVLSGGHFLSQQADHDEESVVKVGIWAMVVCFELFAIVVPLVQMFALLGLWTFPMTLHWQKRYFFLNEVLNAWSALTIYFVSVIVTLAEVGQICKGIMGKVCDPLQPVLNFAVDLGMINSEDANCLMMGGSVYPGPFIMLFLACVFQSYTCQLITRAGEIAIDEREMRITGHPMHEEDEKGCGKTMVALFLKSVQKMNRSFCCIPCCGLLVSITPIGQELVDQALQDDLWRRAQATSPMQSLAAACDKDPKLRRQVSGVIGSPTNAVWKRIQSSSGAADPHSLPPNWTSTMWDGQVIYWNSVTGRTSSMPPEPEDISYDEGSTSIPDSLNQSLPLEEAPEEEDDDDEEEQEAALQSTRAARRRAFLEESREVERAVI